MKKIIAWLLVLTLTAAVSIGATLAYLTDTDEDVNVMTLGKVKIEQLEYERIDDETANEDATVQEFQNNKPLYPAVTDKNFDYTPGDSNVDWEQIGKDGYTSEIWDPSKINNEIDKMVFVKNKGDYDAFVRSVMAFEAAPGWSFDDFQSKVHLNLNDTDWTWQWVETPVSIGEGTYFVAVVTYNDVLKPGALTEISLSQIALDKTATNEDLKALGETYNVLVKSQGIQADGFETAVMALDDGFGAITASAVPFTTDQPVKGIDLRSALRFYQGDANQPIHTEVTNVVFGLNKDHPDIVNNYTGTLVTEEQNSEVYTYYVKEGGKYSVYFLSNGRIYLPADSGRLFQEMTALTKVDTSNLNTSRVELMNHLFYKCKALAEVDVSGFDTSKVTTMKSMFNNCASLPGVDVSKWDTSKVTDMSYMFRYLTMEELDLSGLDLDSVTDLSYMISFSSKLKKVNATGWNTKNVTSTMGMFMDCFALAELTGSGDWYLPNNTSTYYMFQNCKALKTLDVTNWDCSKVTDMMGTFYYCTGLKEIKGIGNWDTGSATTMAALFHDCTSLESVDVSNFNTENVIEMSWLFRNCRSLKEVDVANWDVSKVQGFNCTFSGAGHNTGEMQFTYLPVENWDVSSAVNMECMFYGCGNLTSLDLSKWRPGKVTNFRHTFADCFKLESIDFTGWTTESAVSFDGMFNDCYSLKELDLSDLDTGNCTNFAQFFEGCGSLKTVKGMENWDVSKVDNFNEMFNANGKNMQLEYVDLSSFNTLSLVDTYRMFNGCPKLTTVYVGDGWDMSKVTSSGAMFGSCSSLVGANGTTTKGNPTDVTYARVDTPAVVDAEGNVITEAVPGYLTYKAAPEAP